MSEKNLLEAIEESKDSRMEYYLKVALKDSSVPDQFTKFIKCNNSMNESEIIKSVKEFEKVMEDHGKKFLESRRVTTDEENNTPVKLF